MHINAYRANCALIGRCPVTRSFNSMSDAFDWAYDARNPRVPRYIYAFGSSWLVTTLKPAAGSVEFVTIV